MLARFLRRLGRRFALARQERRVARWRREGCPLPMPGAAKRALLAEVAARHGLKVFVETGTHRGDTVAALREQFTRLVTIELEPAKVETARQRFSKDPGVEVLEGDSAQVLPGVVARLTEPALFWLDGHYMGPGSGDATDHTPISAEIDSVLRHPVRRHVLLIDDARLFVGAEGYPRLDDLRASVAAQRPDLLWQVEHDVIRLEPPVGGTEGQRTRSA